MKFSSFLNCFFLFRAAWWQVRRFAISSSISLFIILRLTMAGSRMIYAGLGALSVGAVGMNSIYTGWLFVKHFLAK